MNDMNVFEKAKWIWLEDYDKVNVFVTFSDKFRYEGGEAKLYVSVDTNYALYVNDRFVDAGQYADYPFDKVYDELDITAYLTEGKNTLRFDCWHQGDNTSTIRGETAGLIYSVYSGENCLLASSARALAAPITQYDMGGSVEFISGQLGRSFRYDSTREDAVPVKAVKVRKELPVRIRPVKKLINVGDAEAKLGPRGVFSDSPKGTMGQRMQYASLTFADPNVWQKLPDNSGITLAGGERGEGVFAVIDLGKEDAGFFSIDVELPCDAEILCGWGEHLEDMRVRAFVGGRNFACSYKGRQGRNTFFHPFRRLGCRYLELHIYAPSAKIYYAGIKPTVYPLSQVVPFRCADSMHNDIYDVCLRTLLMCMHEHYEDCPWREQALYAMDSRNQMLCGYYAFREFDFAKASIRLMAQSIRDDNMLELCSPARVSITIPSFTAIFLTQLAEYVSYSGDLDFAREMLPYAIRIADGFTAAIDEEKKLIPCYKEAQYWNFYEWQDGLSGSIGGSVGDDDVTFDAPLNAFVAFGMRALSGMLCDIDEDELSVNYYNVYCELCGSINRYFWNGRKGAYASYIRKNGGEPFHYCELTNSLVLYALDADNPAYDARRERAREALASGRLIPVTLSHSIFKYEVLLGCPDGLGTRFEVDEEAAKKYGRYVFEDIADKWGFMLRHDATTFWETIDGAPAFGNAGSLCHGWSAIPAYLYHKYALEIPAEYTGLYECRAKN